MSVTALASKATGTQFPSSTSTTTAGKSKQLNANDFINLMLTQLQHQDPTQPTNSDQLLSQMSQISQLQSSTQLQTSLTSLVTQSQIGAAGNLIGKTVQGMDSQNNTITGVVNSVRVQKDQVFLELDNSKELALGNVTTIAAAPVAGAVAGTPSK